MGLPDIVIEFTKKAIASIAVGTGGIVGIILKDAKENGAHTLRSVESVPAELSDENKAYITRAFLGAPQKIILYVLPTAAKDYTEAFTYFGNHRVNYLCGDPAITQENATALSSWVKSKRKAGKIKPVAVVPGIAGDDEGVVNVVFLGTGENPVINEGDTAYTAPQYCSRIAGLLAGLDMNVSATFKPLTEITHIPVVEDEEVDEAIDAGKLVPFDTGSGIVIARGVNSLTTTSAVKTADLQKIKIVAIQDLITTDIMDTINKNYIGNYPNSYDNKCLLITAILGYLKQLELKGYLERDRSTMEINVEKQRAYLESVGTDTSEMDDQAVKEANTGSHVFLKGSVSILDAIEDVDIIINKE